MLLGGSVVTSKSGGYLSVTSTVVSQEFINECQSLLNYTGEDRIGDEVRKLLELWVTFRERYSQFTDPDKCLEELLM